MADYAKDSEKQAALRRQIRPRRANRQRHDKHERDGDRQSFLLHFVLSSLTKASCSELTMSQQRPTCAVSVH